ncbi:MAG: hypothetical protein F4Y08_07415 [Caldilineaceae bacterium SB0662_bin_9]|uniref:Type II secretion system protein GspF domain-containing protein n=1 Tax=Caldilineaceae bacterium SB0662_bin_9 TaxID=2605258 RepID=A0A6B1DTP2_9CHLR|nr:hypothetical protein [Caldilineaceae bacterium SB0662_bin_9]
MDFPLPETLALPFDWRQGALLAGCACAGLAIARLWPHLRWPGSRRQRESARLASWLAPYRGLDDAAGSAVRRHISVDPERIILGSLHIRSPRVRLWHLRLLGSLLPVTALLLARFPVIPALMGGLLGYAVADAWLRGRWHRFQTGIEEELPVFVSRLGAMLLLTESMTACLDEVVDTLDPESSALRVWMQLYQQGLRHEGRDFLAHARTQALRISPSLALVVFQLGRMAETGGTGFARAFARSASGLQALLEVRAVAAAKAESARNSIVMLLVIMGVVIALMALSPGLRAGYALPTSQFVLVGALGTMAFGYYFLNGMISDVLG